MANWCYRFTLPDGEHCAFTSVPRDEMTPDTERQDAARFIRKSVLSGNPEASLLDETLVKVQHNGHMAELIQSAIGEFVRRYPNRLPINAYTAGAPVRVLSQPWLVPGTSQMPDPERDADLAKACGLVMP